MDTTRLVCIYVCEADSGYLDLLTESALFGFIRGNPAYSILKVFADPGLTEPRFENDRLYVPCREQYVSLSVKTYEMIAACMRFKFDNLIKIDGTVSAYWQKRQNKTERMMELLHPDSILAWLRTERNFDCDYTGISEQCATENGFNNWLATKEISGDYRRVFAHGEKSPQYYIGKCYQLSRSFCSYIAAEGKNMALEHERYLGGAEDLMIGRLFQGYQRSVAMVDDNLLSD